MNKNKSASKIYEELKELETNINNNTINSVIALKMLLPIIKSLTLKIQQLEAGGITFGGRL